VQAFSFLLDVTTALEATRAGGEAQRLRLQLQRQLVSPEVAACLVALVNCFLLPCQDASAEQVLTIEPLVNFMCLDLAAIVFDVAAGTPIVCISNQQELMRGCRSSSGDHAVGPLLLLPLMLLTCMLG
jgi:hypothetical protein